MWTAVDMACCPAKNNVEVKSWEKLQASDWGEPVPVGQIAEALERGTRKPATGVMVFVWGSLRNQPAKIEELGRFYRAIR